jgi:hypothetical protein
MEKILELDALSFIPSRLFPLDMVRVGSKNGRSNPMGHLCKELLPSIFGNAT